MKITADTYCMMVATLAAGDTDKYQYGLLRCGAIVNEWMAEKGIEVIDDTPECEQQQEARKKRVAEYTRKRGDRCE